MSTATSEIETVELFNELIETCRNGESGFTIASEAVRQSDLKRLIATYAKQRRRFATELRAEVLRLGGVLESLEAVSPANGRAWPRRTDARIDDECTILTERALAEDQAVRDYQKAETVDLTPPLRAIIDRQSTAIAAARNRIHELKRQCKRSA